MASSPEQRLFPPVPLKKSPTGIVGFDEITDGGLPAGRTTLLVGGPGTGKTVFALQTLVNGARLRDEPGIFVAFEENARQLRDNAATFGWDLDSLERDRLFFLDARVSPSTLRTGEFELEGLLASIAAKARAMNARRVVFDSLDVLLYLLKDEVAEREEMYRLQGWLLSNGLTGILTAKAGLTDSAPSSHASFVQFMADTVIQLRHELVDRVAVRHLRVLKYRGSSFADNEFPLVFGSQGIEVGGLGLAEKDYDVSTEKISLGVERLDTMLDGGIFRGSSFLVSGSPGTAKTTLAGAFVKACCERGDTVLYCCFDEGGNEILRNLTSVNLHLAPYAARGLLHMVPTLRETRNPEEHFLSIRRRIAEHNIKALVVDPISALVKAGGEDVAVVAVQRLIRLTRSLGVTLFLTSLLGSPDTLLESTPIQISTLADTWIHISYVVRDGERNRALTIVKSRGTRHSNQVRELLLSSEGVTLADVFTSQGQVLMGTARWQQEAADRREAELFERRLQRRQRQLAARQQATRARLEILQRELEAQEAAQLLLQSERTAHREQRRTEHDHLHDLRGGDRGNEGS